MHNKRTTDAFERAKEYAFLLLKFRQRSETEIRQRLERKKFDTAIIKDTVAFLTEKGFLDDRRFAVAWAESRLKKPFGLRRVRQELKIKGICGEVIEEVSAEAGARYPEKEIVEAIVRKRLKGFAGEDTVTIKRRLYGYLLRRGFSCDVTTETINRLLKQ
ncbi:MAG: regulatory protein RecX [Candidatus Omnitrophota bacterium]